MQATFWSSDALSGQYCNVNYLLILTEVITKHERFQYSQTHIC